MLIHLSHLPKFLSLLLGEYDKIFFNSDNNNFIKEYNASTNIHAVYDNKLIAICFAEEFQQNIESLQSDIDLYAKIRRPLLSKDTLSSLIERFTPYAQKTNAVIQVVQLKSE